MLRKLTLTLVMLGTAAGPAGAQPQIGLSALAGGYVPVSDLFDDLRLGTQTVINLGQEPGLAAGGRLTLWSGRVGIEVELAYALAGMDLPQRLVDAGASDDAHVFLGSVNALYVIFQAPFSPLSVHLSGGAGIVGRGGEFFDQFEDTRDMAGALGVGLRFGLGRATRLRFDVRDYISSFAPTRQTLTPAGDVQFDSKLQNDVIATIALEFVLTPAR
jgi:hypothetical protein